MEYTEKSETIQGANSNVIVTSEDPKSEAVVHVYTPQIGTSLTEWEMFSLIETMLKVSGTPYELTGAMDLIIRRPESPYVAERREEFAQKFFNTSFENVEDTAQDLINFIIEGEIKRGELR